MSVQFFPRQMVVLCAITATVVWTTFSASGWSAAPAPAHAHPEKGPHGGPLLELGDEEYHGEVLLDEKAGTMTFYVLDSAAKEVVPIEAKEILFNLKHSGKPIQYKLPAVPAKTDPEGLASCFQLKSPSLVHALHHKDHGARVALKIKGKSYTAKYDLEHDHDHKH
ncbi:MAG: hypothetical protein B7Z55_07285 [Planctomycetales bacterium 12-60-4]|nr:MAG: hypothetical protein B7Z55_07285 [Planctomycetales bacterium 12-60-4]